MESRRVRILSQMNYTGGWTITRLAAVWGDTVPAAKTNIQKLQREGIDVQITRKSSKNYYSLAVPANINYLVQSPASEEIEHHRFILTADWHGGNPLHDHKGLLECLDIAIDSGAEFQIHAGDLTDGNMHPEQIKNQLTSNAKGQIRYAFADLPEDLIMYMLDGDHDISFTKGGGVSPGESIRRENFYYLGSTKAILVVGGVEIEVAHPKYRRGDSTLEKLADRLLGNRPRADAFSIFQFLMPQLMVIGGKHRCAYFESNGVDVFFPGHFTFPTDLAIEECMYGERGLVVFSMRTQYGKMLDWSMQKIPSRSSGLSYDISD